jgi:transposase
MRYEPCDHEWAAIKPMLPNKPRGVRRVNDRRVLSGIFWVLRSGAPWRRCGKDFGLFDNCFLPLFCPTSQTACGSSRVSRTALYFARLSPAARVISAFNRIGPTGQTVGRVHRASPPRRPSTVHGVVFHLFVWAPCGDKKARPPMEAEPLLSREVRKISRGCASGS